MSHARCSLNLPKPSPPRALLRMGDMGSPTAGMAAQDARPPSRSQAICDAVSMRTPRAMLATPIVCWRRKATPNSRMAAFWIVAAAACHYFGCVVVACLQRLVVPVRDASCYSCEPPRCAQLRVRTSRVHDAVHVAIWCINAPCGHQLGPAGGCRPPHALPVAAYQSRTLWRTRGQHAVVRWWLVRHVAWRA